MVTVNQRLDFDQIELIASTSSASRPCEEEYAAEVRGPIPSRTRLESARGAAAGGHHHGPRRPRQDVAARLHPQGQRRRRRGRRHHAAHRRVPRRPCRATGKRSPSSTRRVTRRSPPCAPAAPRSPTSSCWSSRPTTRSCRRRSRRSATPRTPACRIIVAINKIDLPERQRAEGQAGPAAAQRRAGGVRRQHALGRRSRPRRAPASTRCSSRSCSRPRSST